MAESYRAVDSRADEVDHPRQPATNSGGSVVNIVQTSKKPQVAIMNAVHDLPVLVARDHGFFRDEGLDIDFVTTPGMAQVTTSHLVKFDSIFERPLESVYNDGGIDQFRMCEWGIMKRAVESNVEDGHRPAKIVALGSAMSTFAIATDPKLGIYEPEQLKNEPIGVSPFNGSHFTMLKMMEGFIKRDEIKWANAGTHKERIDALRAGKVKAVSLMEPWISVAEKAGCRVLIESHSTRSEAAGEELDGPTLAKMFRAEARAAAAIDRNPEKYAHYLIEEAGGLIDIKDLRMSRILNAPPVPYTRDRFNDNYQWTLGWGLVPPGATYEKTVDNRAWH
jgi:NitT/TauT family transport system substrate-binding protein